MLRPFAILSAMSLAASMRRSSIMPGPATLVASEMSLADSDSPSARMTAAFRSCGFAQKLVHQSTAYVSATGCPDLLFWLIIADHLTVH